jgi:hypothetical protein
LFKIRKFFHRLEKKLEIVDNRRYKGKYEEIAARDRGIPSARK